MTIHTRYRATMQVALGQAARDEVGYTGHNAEAPPSELGTRLLHRLEQQGLTLTRLPVNDHAKDTAIWGLIDAWDDFDRADWPNDAEAFKAFAVTLFPWQQKLVEIMTTVPRPTDEPGDTDPPWRFEVEEVGGQQPTDYGTGTEDWAEWHWTLGTGGFSDVVLSGVEVNEDPTSVLAHIVSELNARALVGDRSAPTRERLYQVLRDAYYAEGRVSVSQEAHDRIKRMVDSLAGLLSRSAAEPPEDAVRALQAIVDDDVYAHTLSGLAQFRVNALAIAQAALADGVAAGPQTTPTVLYEDETHLSPALDSLGDQRTEPAQESFLDVPRLPVPPGTRVRVVAAPTSQQDPTDRG